MSSLGGTLISGAGPGRLALILAALLLGLSAVGPTQAQPVRADNVFYSKFGGGYAEYTGDLPVGANRSVFDLRGLDGGNGIPALFTTELGYHFSPQFSLALGFQEGTFPFVGLQQSGEGHTWRYTYQLLSRYTFTGPIQTVAPYVDGGLNVTFGGDTPLTSAGYGSSVGAGLDVLLTRSLSFYVESRLNLTFPNDAIDGVGSSSPSFDMVNQLLGVGLKVRFTTPTPPRVKTLNGPTTVQAGAPATFTARINTEEAYRPITYRWNFENAEVESGQTATHTYAQPGTYTLTFTAENEAGETSRSLQVRVKPSPKPATIESLQAKPNPVDVGQSVRFSSTTDGSPPFDYDWRFGDGATASGRNPTYTYEEPGTYTARLRASNADGKDADTTIVRMRRTLTEVCTASKLRAVTFEQGSSSLTEEARKNLQANARILSQCPTSTVYVGATAAPNEKTPKLLSQRRAQTVHSFYTNAGIEQSRIVAIGRGLIESVSHNDRAARQHRLANTAPLEETVLEEGALASGEDASESSLSADDSSPVADKSAESSTSRAISRDSLDTEHWTIVVASMSRKNGARTIAQRYQDRFESESLSIKIAPARLEQGLHHRVTIGRFETHTEAEQALRKHKANFPPAAWLLRLRSAHGDSLQVSASKNTARQAPGRLADFTMAATEVSRTSASGALHREAPGRKHKRRTVTTPSEISLCTFASGKQGTVGRWALRREGDFLTTRVRKEAWHDFRGFGSFLQIPTHPSTDRNEPRRPDWRPPRSLEGYAVKKIPPLASDLGG